MANRRVSAEPLPLPRRRTSLLTENSVSIALVAGGCGLILALALPLLVAKSLWLDEAWVANDVVRPAFDPASLSTTPVGFALLVAGGVKLFPRTDVAFRLIPLLFGLGAVPLTYLWAQRLAGSRFTSGLAVLLIASNLEFLTYCRTLKPYTADAFCAVLILLLAERLRDDLAPRRWAAYTVAIALAPLVSFGCLFVIPVAGSSLLFFPAPDRPAPVRVWLAIHSAVAAALGVYWVTFLRHQSSGALVTYWQGGFPSTSGPLDITTWYGRQTVALTQYFFSPLNAWWAIPLQIAVCLGIAAAVWRRDFRIVLLCCCPLLLGAVAAIARLYPYGGSAGGGRILLFAFPGLLVLAARGLTWVTDRIPGKRVAIGAALLLLATSVPVVDAARYSVSLDHRAIAGDPSEETRSLIRDVLLPHLQPGDALFVSYGAGDAFQYYAPQFRQPRRISPPLFVTRQNGILLAIGAYPWDLRHVVSLHPRRVWLLTAHITAPTEHALTHAARALGHVDLIRHKSGADLFRLIPYRTSAMERTAQYSSRPSTDQTAESIESSDCQTDLWDDK